MNINDYCWTKLTPYGINLLNSISPSHARYNTRESNGEEWIRFQLWEWANFFGEFLMNGSDPIFEKNEITFEEP